MRRRDLNKRLGKAYDLLHSIAIPFFNDPLPRGGRSLKPLWCPDDDTFCELARLADKVNYHPDPPRFHFYVDERRVG